MAGRNRPEFCPAGLRFFLPGPFDLARAAGNVNKERDTGEIELIVEDEQGKINITTAHPALLGNLMASALLTELGHAVLVANPAPAGPAAPSLFVPTSPFRHEIE